MSPAAPEQVPLSCRRRVRPTKTASVSVVWPSFSLLISSVFGDNGDRSSTQRRATRLVPLELDDQTSFFELFTAVPVLVTAPHVSF
ncbi:hypothetical protein SDJN03_03759, partial [Cucurbita argyrosperma subsp. sororia]